MNPTLTEFYTTGAGKDYRKTSTDAYGKGTFAVNEVPASAYTDDVEKSFASYNDAAIVVIGRSGSESQDLPTDKLASGYTYLQLDDDERAMLKMASDNFDKVVVLLNTQNPMELADLEDDSIDAVMWIGSLGQTGAGGVAEALNGTVNPSGHLPDTYAYDLKSAPSSANFGSYAIVNGTDRFTSSYMAYAEGSMSATVIMRPATRMWCSAMRPARIMITPNRLHIRSDTACPTPISHGPIIR